VVAVDVGEMDDAGVGSGRVGDVGLPVGIGMMDDDSEVVGAGVGYNVHVVSPHGGLADVLDVFDRRVGLSRAAEFTFDAWSRLRRCACRYMSLDIGMMSFQAEKQYISPECEEANAVLKQRVGAERWVTEEQLLEARYDRRWSTQMAAQL
jgi:hypothetical protein